LLVAITCGLRCRRLGAGLRGGVNDHGLLGNDGGVAEVHAIHVFLEDAWADGIGGELGAAAFLICHALQNGGALGDVGGVEDDQAVGVDVGGYVEDDADFLIGDGVGDQAGGGGVGAGKVRDFLAGHDGGDLVIAGEDVRTGEHIDLVGGGECAEGSGYVVF